MRAAYLFEAKGIQRWLMEGGRLRDIAAASDLLANVATTAAGDGSGGATDRPDLVGEVLAAAGGFAPRFSRRAGGAFMLHFDESEAADFERFRNLWRLAFMQAAPGLEFIESFGKGENDLIARDAAYKHHRRNKDGSPAPQPGWAHERRYPGRENGFASLIPLGGPMVVAAQRTGRPAVGSDHEILIDVVARGKRRFAGLGDDLIPGVGARFMPPEAPNLVPKWPTEMEFQAKRPDETETDYRGRVDARGPLFPFKGDDRWIGVVHADISGLGLFYRRIGDISVDIADERKDIEIGRRFAFEASEVIETVLETAAKKATASHLLDERGRDQEKKVEVMPARPVLLGGDDVTGIVRGDLALDWTRTFLEVLEEASTTALSAFAGRYELSDEQREGIAVALTACAGIAFGKSKQPFFRLLDLADGLCSLAKKTAKAAARAGDKPPASMIAFHRVTESALAASADELFEALEMNNRCLSAQPYRVGGIEAAGHPAFSDLAEVKRMLAEGSDAFKRGALRELRKLLLDGGLDDQAEETWRRWKEMAKKRGGDVEGFEKQLAKASGGQALDPGLPFAGGEGKARSALFDAIEWEAVT
jgi:hypothetical protein